MFSKILFAAVAVLAVVEANVIPVVQVPVHHAPQPYSFGYSIKDHHGQQHRAEVGDGVNGVKGSYGFTDDRGIHRQVNYVADHAGFRAQVKTNEPGTANQNPAAVQVISSAPYAGHVAPVVAPVVVKAAPVVVETPVYAAQAVPVVKGYGYGF